MRVKSLFIVIVLNIFLMLFVSLLLEYLSLDERFNQLMNNISVCAEMTVDTVTASEEMFSEDYNNKMISYASRFGMGGTSAAEKVSSKTLVFLKNASGTKKVLTPVNSYVLAMYYEKKPHGEAYKRLPKSIGEYNSFSSSLGTDKTKAAFEFMYGSAGCQYDSSSLSWANNNKSKLKDASDLRGRFGSSRTPTSTFKKFYDNIGKDVKTVGFIKNKNGEAFDVNEEQYSVLANMGLSLGSINGVGYSKTADNFTSSVHVGKQYEAGTKNKGASASQYSYYYLTPASLGVTYIPREVFVPVFQANLDTMVRLQKISGGVTSKSSADDLSKLLDSATGCVSTGVYDYGNNDKGILNLLNTSGQTHSKDSITNEVLHKTSAGEQIVNDGTTEYDLSSVQVKVDYFYVDFSNSSTARLAAKLNGLVEDPSNTDHLQYTRSQFISNDTGLNAGVAGYDDVRTKRLVARVSVRMKVHVLYQSKLLQWLCYRNGTSPHFDVKSYNPKDGKVYSDSNGVWYQTTLYYCQSR